MKKMVNLKLKDNYTILISDANSRKGFDIINIIKNKLKYHTTLASAKDFKIQLPLVYFSKVYKLRYDSINNFEKDLLYIENKVNKYLVFIPVSEKATRFFIMLKDKGILSKRWKFVLPKLETFNLASDKWRFQQFCENNNHPVPKSITPSNFNNIIKNFRPIVLKPKSGQGSVGIKYFHKLSEVPELSDINWETNLIQEKIISDKRVSGAFFFRFKNKIQNEYCHQRLRVFPPEGGVTVYSKSLLKPDILEAGKKLLDDLKWEGLAMIEFMYDVPSKTWKIIELNPRLWGSVLLSEYNGSNMLKSYIEASLHNEAVPVMAEKTRTVFIRWVLPFDLLALFRGKISLKTFMTFNRENTCYINFTYAPFIRAWLFFIYFLFNLDSILRFVKKMR